MTQVVEANTGLYRFLVIGNVVYLGEVVCPAKEFAGDPTKIKTATQ